MLFLVEEDQHMKLMVGAFNKNASLTQKSVTLVLKTVLFGEIVNMIGSSIQSL